MKASVLFLLKIRGMCWLLQRQAECLPCARWVFTNQQTKSLIKARNTRHRNNYLAGTLRGNMMRRTWQRPRVTAELTSTASWWADDSEGAGEARPAHRSTCRGKYTLTYTNEHYCWRCLMLVMILGVWASILEFSHFTFFFCYLMLLSDS